MIRYGNSAACAYNRRDAVDICAALPSDHGLQFVLVLGADELVTSCGSRPGHAALCFTISIKYGIPFLTYVRAYRFSLVAGTTVLAYDTVLTLSLEIHYVWSPLIQWRKYNGTHRKQNPLLFMLRLLILVIRYAMLAVAGIYLMSERPYIFYCSVTVMTPNLRSSINTTTYDGKKMVLLIALSLNQYLMSAPAERCKSAISATGKLDAFVEVVGSCIVLQRLYLLWDFERRITLLLVSGTIMLKMLSFSFAIAATAQIDDSVIFAAGSPPSVQSCAISKIPFLYLVSWASWDLFAFSLFFLNALSRPRTESQKLLDIIYRDGMLYFLTTLASMGFLFSGTMVTMAATRSFLRLFHFSHEDALCGRCDGVGASADYGYCLCGAYHDGDPFGLGEENCDHASSYGFDGDAMRLEETSVTTGAEMR
ncbi:hypothetical protein M0805_002579 [Coniferiporia weirii]|nr:hypothetical protein M0805_002579 [Coniferiporia weirii]